jgi:hypothetical protein
MMKQKFIIMLRKHKISAILNEMLLMCPADETIISIVNRYNVWNTTYNYDTKPVDWDWDIFFQEKVMIRKAVVLLIQDFDENKAIKNGIPESVVRAGRDLLEPFIQYSKSNDYEYCI